MSAASHVHHATGPDVAESTAGPGRIRLIAGVLVAAAATLAALVITRPAGNRVDSSAEEILSYDSLLLPDRSAAWLGMVVNGFTFAVVGLCAALGTCLLVRQRGRRSALVGSLLTVVGGLLFAMGSFGLATLTWLVTSDGLPEDAGRHLIALANDAPMRLVGLQIVGFLLATLGGLVLAVALAHAGAVPVVAAVGFAVLTFGLFAPLPGRGVDVTQALQMLLVALLAIPLWRDAGCVRLRSHSTADALSGRWLTEPQVPRHSAGESSSNTSS